VVRYVKYLLDATHLILMAALLQINLPQGNVDLSFRLKGHRGECRLLFMWFDMSIYTSSGSGTVYFTSIRKTKGEPFTPRMFPMSELMRISSSHDFLPKCDSE
jgi:hypothetical protein